MTKIDKSDIDQYWSYLNKASAYGNKIEERCDYIIRKIFISCGGGVEYWHFNDAPEGDQGSLHRALDADSVSNFTVETLRYYDEDHQLLARLDDGSLVELYNGFPLRWLYEDFEDELDRGKKRYEKEQLDAAAKNKEEKAAKKREKEKLKVSAAAKLTEEERKALGLA
jgi:hypothetical protein